MIEYSCLKHKGNAEVYSDEVYISIIPHLTIAILYGSEMGEKAGNASLILGDLVSGDEIPFDELTELAEIHLPDEAQYLILRVEGDFINIRKKGKLFSMIMKDGQMKELPNGVFGLAAGDRIVCGTENFYKYLTSEGILADCLVSSDCEEWKDLVTRRISDKTELLCGNLSAVFLMPHEL